MPLLICCVSFAKSHDLSEPWFSSFMYQLSVEGCELLGGGRGWWSEATNAFFQSLAHWRGHEGGGWRAWRSLVRWGRERACTGLRHRQHWVAPSSAWPHCPYPSLPPCPLLELVTDPILLANDLHVSRVGFPLVWPVPLGNLGPPRSDPERGRQDAPGIWFNHQSRACFGFNDPWSPQERE